MKYPTFASWVHKRRRARAAAGRVSEGPPAVWKWVEATVAGDGGVGRGLLVHLPGGARVEIADGSQVGLAAEVLRVLADGARGAAMREDARC